MSTRDLLLAELYRVPRSEAELARATRHAPILYFDEREPFLPLAAGYTLFTRDGPSPSFDRTVELRPEDKEPAALAIEYAIWWDWDIHHLYELEHVWIFLDGQERPVRVEASWHGKYYDIPLTLKEGRALLLSEPGKHAFAPDPAWFQQRAREKRRLETLAVGLHSQVLVNELFKGKIRERAFDRVLARSFLMQRAFTPTWRFNREFRLRAEWLVPWAALRAWIPRRVNSVLEWLENHIHPKDYRALRLASPASTLAGLQAAARSGADAILAPLTLYENRLVLGAPGPDSLDGGSPLDLNDALDFCLHEPLGIFLEVTDPAVIDPLAWFVRSKRLNDTIFVVSADAQLLARYDAFVSDGLGVIQMQQPDQDPLMAATESGALFVNPLWDAFPEMRRLLTREWIRRVHKTGLGIMSWPVSEEKEFEELQRLGLDILWQK